MTSRFVIRRTWFVGLCIAAAALGFAGVWSVYEGEAEFVAAQVEAVPADIEFEAAFDETYDLSNVLGPGWEFPKAWGLPMKERQATLRLNVPRPAGGDIEVVVRG